MIRSIRLKFFVIVWPLVVAALVIFASLLGNWSKVELRRMSMQVESIRRLGNSTRAIADSLAVVPRSDTAGMRVVAARFVARDSALQGVVIASEREGILLNTLPGVPDGDITFSPPGTFLVQSVQREGGMEAVIRAQVDGVPVDAATDADPRFVALLPTYAPHRVVADDPAAEAAPGRALQRRILQAVLVGSLIAAILTLVLSGRLTGRITALAGAAGELGRGNLAARVPVEGDDEVAGLAGAFNEMAASLEDSEAQRRRMVSDVAHELRTPLTNMIGLVRMALDGIRPADHALLESLEEESLLLQRLVDDLRDLALADAGELRVQVEAVEVGSVVQRAVAAFDPRAGIAVGLPEPSPVALADAHRLGQVLRNLIQNAVTHSGEAGSVRVAVGAVEGRVEITVADRGPGIAPEHLERIWDRFYRVDPSRTRETGGMGLGLAVAHRLVEAMGGTIGVESVVGEGTRFTVRLRKG